ncbi:acyltransferase family protein [Acidisarcina polymorpha]|uniref:acyltransferase family protein n=1 Tax=Acidisarcina polymorpha TaxID=2211140 RepID=UPI0013750822|nr:acyltransferase family protein [Acidisarcina polymorpha]
MNLHRYPSTTPRFHSLDSLRAGMMFLGIVLHGVLPYTGIRMWPVNDPTTHPIFWDAIVFAIHVFRMLLFFVLAGFFAHLLYERLGAAGFLYHRTKRILLPFAIGWLALYLPTIIGVQYGIHVRDPHPWVEVSHYFSSGLFLSQSYTMHLWFLYYLYCSYLLCLAILILTPSQLRTRLQQPITMSFRAVTNSRWRAFILAVPTCALLYVSPIASFGAPEGWLPTIIDLATYGYFFAFGWYLFAEIDLLLRLQQHAVTHLTIAFVLGPIAFRLHGLLRHEPRVHIPLIAMTAIICWCLIIGLIGIGNRYWNGGSPHVRYFADASYWVYLVHYPLVIWLQIALLFFHMPVILKFILVISATTVLSLASYHLFVRYTLIGKLLNGTRHRTTGATVECPTVT